MVWEACSNASPILKKRIEAKLIQMDHKLIKTKRPYRDGATWIENALEVNQTEPFHAVISLAAVQSERVLVADDLDEDTPSWKVEKDGNVRRIKDELVEVVAPLLRHATEILFVDQHFDFNAKHRRPLVGFLGAARKGKSLTRIEYHLNAKVSSEYFASELIRCFRMIGLHPNETIIFVRWKCIDGGENQHPRYILTNRGGLRYDYGLDEGAGTTDWSRLGEALWKERKSQYDMLSPAFEFVDAWHVTAEGANRVRWDRTKWVAS